MNFEISLRRKFPQLKGDKGTLIFLSIPTLPRLETKIRISNAAWPDCVGMLRYTSVFQHIPRTPRVKRHSPEVQRALPGVRLSPAKHNLPSQIRIRPNCTTNSISNHPPHSDVKSTTLSFISSSGSRSLLRRTRGYSIEIPADIEADAPPQL